MGDYERLTAPVKLHREVWMRMAVTEMWLGVKGMQ